MNKFILPIVIIAVVLGSVGCFLPIGGTTIVEKTVGAVSSPDINSNWIRFGGVLLQNGSMDMKTATTTLCAMISPTATSTLDFVSWNMTNTSLGDVIYISTSTSAVATTSSPALRTKTAAASGKENTNWSTVGGGTGDNVMSPSTYVLVRTASTSPTSFSPTGQCKVKFTVL